MGNRECIITHRQWWTRTHPHPLVGLFAPVPVPFGGLDIDVPPDQIVARKRRNAEALACVPGDKLAVATVNFSTAFVPSLAGAGFAYDAHTSWALPVASRIQDVKVMAFDPRHLRFEAYLRRLEPLLAAWSWETFLPGLADYLGPLDILAGMLGPEALAVAMLDEPALVRDRARAAAGMLRAMLDYELNLHRQAGLTDGVTDVFATWLPGRGVRFSEDVSSLVGERHFRELFVEADAAAIAGLDSVFLHMHSVALPCLPAILEMPNLGAIELSNDPNGPPLDVLIAAGQRIQAAGKPFQLSNWNHPLTEAEIRRALERLDPRGLCITLQAASLAHARELFDSVHPV